MEYVLYLIQCFAAIFAILNPFGTVPVLLSLTEDLTKAERNKVILKACFTAFGTLMVFGVAGEFVFNLFHITLGAFRIAGGILLFIIAMSMLYAQQPRSKITPSEQAEAEDKEDIAITPLGIPMISGPGTIATVMSLMDDADTMIQKGVVLLAIPITVTLAYIIFRFSPPLMRFLGHTGLRVMTRLMGLMLAVIAVQFVINGLHDAVPMILKK